jgi:hypothetical protein
VWMTAEGGRVSRPVLLRADGEPSLGPAYNRGSRIKLLGGLFEEWLPAEYRIVRLVLGDDTTRLASSANGAWVTNVSIDDPHHTWIEFVDPREDAYLRRRLDSLLAFVGISWTVET